MDSGGIQPEIRFNIVCEVTAGSVDRYRYVSVVAEYNNSFTVLTSQFEFSCEEDDWNVKVSDSTDNTITTPPDANFTTPLRRDCYLCLSPERSRITDTIHHCAGMCR